MELGTRMRYGMIAMFDLARRGQTEPVRAVDIANAAGISTGYLEGLLASLRRGGLVRAIRGPGGGWQLTRPPSKLRATQIYSVLEGSTALVRCAEFPEACDSARGCGARRLWARMSKALETALREETLAQLAGLVAKKKASTKTLTTTAKKVKSKKKAVGKNKKIKRVAKVKAVKARSKKATSKRAKSKIAKSAIKARKARPSARGRVSKQPKIKLVKGRSSAVRKKVVKAAPRLRKSA